ncbi:MAG TPA: phospholipase D-like domain-containing protein [Thermotogota bacterium]|nr:phospholipase D-like domain-containing protein [Thermotogota bacterium]
MGLLFLPLCTGQPIQGEFQVVFREQGLRDFTRTFIAQARRSLDVCIYDLQDPEMVALVNERAAHGVSVRLFTENAHQAIEGLSAEVARKCDDASGLMHCKYMIRDSDALWLSSANLTPTSLDLHENFGVLTYSPQLIAAFQEHFDSFFSLFPQSKQARADVGVFFSPGDAPFDELVGQLARARESILIGMYAFSDYRLARTLAVLAANGVRVHVLADKDWNLSGPYSVVRDLFPFCQVRYDTREPGLLHEKFALVDGRTLVLGSYNWTLSAQQKNHEFLLVTRDALLVDAFQQHFWELWHEYSLPFSTVPR